jgi:hypothetical protein
MGMGGDGRGRIWDFDCRSRDGALPTELGENPGPPILQTSAKSRNGQKNAEKIALDWKIQCIFPDGRGV